MACEDWGGDMFEALGSGAFRDFALCEYQTAFGGPEFALLFFGIIAIGTYYRSGSIILPAVLMIVIGGRILAEVAALGNTFVLLVLLALVGIGPVLLLRRLGKL